MNIYCNGYTPVQFGNNKLLTQRPHTGQRLQTADAPQLLILNSLRAQTALRGVVAPCYHLLTLLTCRE